MCKESFNEKDFAAKEYAMLRYWIMGEKGTQEFTAREKNNFKTLVEEILQNEEYLKYAVTITCDICGKKYLNGVITPFIIISNFESVKSEITDVLLNNLLFEYHDEEKTLPLAIAGRGKLGFSYLEAILSNQDINIKKIYHNQITECVILGQKKYVNYNLLTLFFIREDIPIECKKKVIDSLDDEALYILIQNWEEDFMDVLMQSFNIDVNNDGGISEEELLEFEKEMKKIKVEKRNLFSEIVNLIEDKLYS